MQQAMVPELDQLPSEPAMALKPKIFAPFFQA